MANTANIKAVITADDRASATLKSFGNNVETVGDKVQKSMKIAALAAGAILVAGITASVKAAFEQVDAVQQATVALKAYEGNASKVTSTLSDLVKFARSDMGVLFQRQDLFKSAQALKIMGDNTDDLVGHVKILSRSVGLGLSNWDDLNLIVGRVGSTGRLTGEDFDNLTKAGYRLDPALRNTNISFAELFKNLDKGIPADALAGQADTIRGRLVKLQSSFRDVGLAIIGVDQDTGKFIQGGLGDRFINGLTTATEMLKSLRTAYQNILPDIQRVASQVGEYLAPHMATLVAVVRDELIPVLSRFWHEVIEPLAPIIGTVFVYALGLAIDALGAMISLFSTLLGASLTAKQYVQDFAGTVVGAFDWVGRKIGELRAWFNDLNPFIKGAMAGVAGAIAGPFREAFSLIAHYADNIVEAINKISRAAGGLSGTSLFKKAVGAALHIPGFASGGYTGQGNSSEIAGVVHKGEYVVPSNQVNQSTGLPIGGGSINININAGALMGSDVEARKFAQIILGHLKDSAGAKNMSLPQMMGM